MSSNTYTPGFCSANVTIAATIVNEYNAPDSTTTMSTGDKLLVVRQVAVDWLTVQIRYARRPICPTDKQ
jgi:hypothetical protein